MKTNDVMKLGLVMRGVEIRGDDVSEEERTIEIAFSSEAPYERMWGVEILSHDPKHVDMKFIGSGNAPLLVGHNHEDQIGVIEKAWLQDGVGRARVRFGRSARAEEIFQDVRDGIRKNVSVGYRIHEMEEQETKGELPVYRVTRWSPVETSLVAVPADPTVGIRSASDETETIVIRAQVEPAPKPKEKSMENKEAPKPVEATVDMQALRDAERKRQSDILALGRMSGLESQAQTAITSDVTAEQFRASAFDAMVEKQAKPAVDMAALSDGDKRDIENYSFVKAMREAAKGGLSGFEAEMHDEAVKNLRSSGVTAQGQLAIPYQVLAHRSQAVMTDAGGGYTVATNLLAGSFIDLLRNRLLVRGMGARVLDNLQGDIAIPGAASGATATWETETSTNDESAPTYRQIEMRPRRLGTYVDISKQLLMQSSISVEQWIRGEIVFRIAEAVDLAGIRGTGANNQPRGLLNTPGIGSVEGGTDGLAPTWAHIVALETSLAANNADVGSQGYLTNAVVRGRLKTTEKANNTGQFIWSDGGGDGFGTLNGYRAGVSNQVPSDLTKGSSSGVCSAILFGNWSDLLLGFWGGLDIVVDPYTLATTNQTRIVCNSYADVAVRHAASFAAMQDALTA